MLHYFIAFMIISSILSSGNENSIYLNNNLYPSKLIPVKGVLKGGVARPRIFLQAYMECGQ